MLASASMNARAQDAAPPKRKPAYGSEARKIERQREAIRQRVATRKANQKAAKAEAKAARPKMPPGTRPGDGTPGPGRPKGVPNKVTEDVKTMIIKALHKAGGLSYLVRQSNENPKAFLSLVGKVLPLDVTSSDGSMRPVVALYMPDNRRDTAQARVIEHEPTSHAAPLELSQDQVQPHGTQCQPVPAAASAEPVSQTPSEPACADQSQACEPVSPATNGDSA